ncbi:MAG: DUF6036 family nucleotidyltransferase [Thermoflexales bacterium]
MDGLTAEDVLALFERFGERWHLPLVVDLIGGSALAFLGNRRSTLDIDYVGSDIHPEGWQIALGSLAAEMRLEIEPVPLAEMVPIPVGASQRCRVVGQFGVITVRVFDAYTIALSKVDRGTNTDIEDVVFLLRRGFIKADAFAAIVDQTLPNAAQYDIRPADLRRNFATLMRLWAELK